jgi:hypothetical protein
VPSSLRERIEKALDRYPVSPSDSLEQALRQLADGLLAEAKEGGVGRDPALTLLAADALVTYACEVRAEQEPERLADMR